MTTITIVPVTCTATRPDGSTIAGVVFRFLLSATDTENGLIVPRDISAVADASGVAVASLWPNGLGAAGTVYRVFVSDPLGGITDLGTCTVPNASCNLYQILDLGPPTTIDAATLAKIAAQAFSVDASNSAIAAHADRLLSDADVVLTHADVVLTHADVVQTGLDRAQTGSDRVQTGLDLTQTGLDKAATSADRTQSDLDAIATAADRTQTGADRVQTGLDKVATAADRVQTGLDKVATAADRVQTGQDKTATAADRVQTGLDKTSTTSSAATANTKAEEAAGSAAQALAIYGTTAAQQAAVVAAQAAQSAAQGYAASAASVVTQDLSGVAAQALHRSPNAVKALFVYDTSKDSDPSWTEKCQHTSWYNEPLNGKWLGACVSATSVAACETLARAISGATTGDYFQASYDGKFYKLNATSGTTRVYRGNKAKFPKLAAFVSENAGGSDFSPQWMTIYDLTEPGRPMWMQFAGDTYGASAITGPVKCIAALNGLVAYGCNYSNYGGYGGSYIANFIADEVEKHYDSGHFAAIPGIAYRNSTTLFTGAVYRGPTITAAMNAVNMVVMPDAPVDALSGMPIPTIAFAGQFGIRLIHGNGLVSGNGTTALGFTSLIFTKDIVAAAGPNDSSWYYALNPKALPTSGNFSLLSDTSSSAPDFNNGVTAAMIGASRSDVIRAPSAALVQKLRNNESTIGKGLSATISNVFNTGWMSGDIRRAYLADSVVESITAPELVTNGTFDTDISGVQGDSVFSGKIWNAGKLNIGGGSNNVWVWLNFATVPGRTYCVSIDYSLVSGASPIPKISIGNGNTSYDATFLNQAIPSAGTNKYLFTATGSSSSIYLFAPTTHVYAYDNISCKASVFDRSYKSANATIFGTLTKALSSPSASNQLVAYSGFSAANYLQEPYSADLDFGTGEWNVSAWVNIPVTLPVSSFPVVGTNSIPAFSLSDWFVSNADATHIATFSGGTLRYQSDTTTPVMSVTTIAALVTIGKSYLVTAVCSAYVSGGVKVFENVGGFLQVTGLGTFSTIVTCTSTIYPAIGRLSVNTDLTLSSVTIKEVGISSIADRSYSSGAGIKLGITGAGFLTATANDGTTTRTVTTTAAYNTASMLKARAVYKTDGSLAIMVNGVQVAVTYGNPLLTLTNTSAVLTIGNSYTLDAPFPGSIALLKLSATAPTAEQRQWMYEQEKQLFRDGAQCLLPDSGAVVDLAYDEVTDKWIAASAANESSWTGLVRTGVTAVPAGANLKVQAGGGVKLNARSTTSPGVDVTIPAYGLREELVKRAEAAARLSRLIQTFDYIGGFTATTVTGNTAVTSVAGSGYPAQTTVKGAIVTGSGIPASTYIVDLVSTTAYLSAKATASASSVQVSFTDFVLPVGYEAVQVSVAGVVKTEGSTKDFTRLFDGFRETIRFGTAPGYTAAVQIRAVRSAT